MNNPYQPPESQLNDGQRQLENEKNPFASAIAIVLDVLAMVVLFRGLALIVDRGSDVAGPFYLLLGGIWFWAATAVRHNSPHRWLLVVAPALLWGAFRLVTGFWR